MSSQSHLPLCRVLPPGEFNVLIPELCLTLQSPATGRIQWHIIPEPGITLQWCCHLVNSLSWFQSHNYATLQGAVTWRNQCHDRATLQSVIIPSAILKIVFRHIFWFFNAVWRLTSDDFRIVTSASDLPLHTWYVGSSYRQPYRTAVSSRKVYMTTSSLL